MMDMIRNVSGNVSAMPRKLHVRFRCVMHLLQNVLDRVRHAIEGMLIKVNILRDELVPAGISKDGFFVSNTSNGDFICKFVNYTTSFLHAVTSVDQRKIMAKVNTFPEKCWLGKVDPNIDCEESRDCFYLKGNSDPDAVSNNLLNARRLDAIIMKNGLGRFISIPKRNEIICNKKRNPPFSAINSIVLQERVEKGEPMSHKVYEGCPSKFDSAAKAFVVLTRELVHTGAVNIDWEDIVQIREAFKKCSKTPDANCEGAPFELAFDDMQYTKKENDQFLLHLLNIDDFMDADDARYSIRGKDDSGISDIVHFIVPFLLFYKHSELMLTELKKTGLDLTSDDEDFLRYCSNISQFPSK